MPADAAALSFCVECTGIKSGPPPLSAATARICCHRARKTAEADNKPGCRRQTRRQPVYAVKTPPGTGKQQIPPPKSRGGRRATRPGKSSGLRIIASGGLLSLAANDAKCLQLPLLQRRLRTGFAPVSCFQRPFRGDTCALFYYYYKQNYKQKK